MSRKYKREQKAYYDRLQTILTPNGLKVKEKRPTHATFVYKNPDMQVMCPFCLHIDPLHKFLISTKQGYHKGMGQCPECKNQMRFESLTSEWTPEQYAEWVYPYSASGFWQKIPYKTWSERMRKIGWAWRFWARYKQLKGEEPHETYAEHMEKEQEEWAKKEGLI